MSAVPGGPSVPVPVIVLPTRAEIAACLEAEAKVRQDKAKVRQDEADAAAEAAVVEAQRQEILKREQEVATCRTLFDSYLQRFQANLILATADIITIQSDSKAETKTRWCASMAFDGEPSPNPLYRRVEVCARPFNNDLHKQAAARIRQEMEKYEPLYPRCSTFTEAVSLHIKYGEHAEVVKSSGMFLLRPTGTRLRLWRPIEDTYRDNWLWLVFFLVPAWTDRDTDPAAMSPAHMRARGITEETLTEDLKLHGFTDEEIKLRVYGSGHEARQAQLQADQAKQAADKATSSCCVVM